MVKTGYLADMNKYNFLFIEKKQGIYLCLITALLLHAEFTLIIKHQNSSNNSNKTYLLLYQYGVS